MKPKSLFPSRLFDRNCAAASGETASVSAANYQRHVDCVDDPERLDQSSCDDSLQEADKCGQNAKCHKKLHFAFTPEKYEPLMDDEAKAKAKEEKKRRKKESYKKVRKNVGKALRNTWKCMMLGLYNFTLGYSAPIPGASPFIPDIHPTSDWIWAEQFGCPPSFSFDYNLYSRSPWTEEF